VILTSPAIAFAGLVGSFAGGIGGGILGGRWFGEDSNEQKVMAFGGAFIGGGLAGKGQAWFDARYEIQTQGFGSNFANIKVVPKEAPKASFGKAASDDYRATFFEANPELKGKVVVHHAVEQQVQKRYPGVVKNEELHSVENLRGIPKEKNSELHLSTIRKEWNKFYRENAFPTKEQLLEKASEIDNVIGSQFNPPIL
jgi:hypothetical protein